MHKLIDNLSYCIGILLGSYYQKTIPETPFYLLPLVTFIVLCFIQLCWLIFETESK